MNLKMRAVIRTTIMLVAIVASVLLGYGLYLIGGLRVIFILGIVFGIFCLYNSNKSQIKYEDEIANINKRYSK
jgi:uncharacterized membrane protein YqjE